jgi:hypothetical protein
MGWWTLNAKKLAESRADLWVLVLYGFPEKSKQFLILPPHELLQRLEDIHGKQKTIQTYLWVTNKDKCWEARGLNKQDRIMIANHAFKEPLRDFTKYLNTWEQFKKMK